jgi:hypothetical protein
MFTFPKKTVVQQEVKKLYDVNREQKLSKIVVFDYYR